MKRILAGVYLGLFALLFCCQLFRMGSDILVGIYLHPDLALEMLGATTLFVGAVSGAIWALNTLAGPKR